MAFVTLLKVLLERLLLCAAVTYVRLPQGTTTRNPYIQGKLHLALFPIYAKGLILMRCVVSNLLHRP